MRACARGEEVTFTVTGHQHYGLIIRTDSDEPGWVEGEYISDLSLRPDQWPPAGTMLRGLVLGYTLPDGRIRVCMRTMDGVGAPHSWPRKVGETLARSG
jgi:hypothetical protein